MNMKLNFRLPSALRPACFNEPATRDTGDTANNPAQPASPPDLRPANKNPRRHSPSRLQMLFAKTKSSQPIFSSPHLEQKLTEIEEITTESFRRYLTQLNRDTFPTSRFNKIMEKCVDHGIEELDQEITPFLENATDQKSRQALQSARSLAKARLREAVEETSLSAGWKAFQPKESKLTWESPDGPLLIKRGLTLQQVKLERADIASGGFGSVSIFKNENGDKLIGKILKDRERPAAGRSRDDLAHELKAYQTIYRAVGPHPNLVNAYGIARVPKNNREMRHGLLNACGLPQALKNSQMKRVLLMDMVPGPTGEKTFEALRKRWNAGKISSEQYWGAMQFIGRRLLDVTEHLDKAGVAHNDIKPKNFLVNEKTGEPVVIDLGLWTEPGDAGIRGTPRFMAPEVRNRQGSSEKSDVFTVGTSLQDGLEEDQVKKLRGDLYKLQKELLELKKKLREEPGLRRIEGKRVKELEKEIRKLAAQHGIEGGRVEELNVAGVREGLRKKAAFKDDEGNMVRTPGTYSAETAYTRFMNSILEKNWNRRVNSAQAKKLPFLSDSMLDDDAAKKVIKETIEWAKEEEKKPKQEQSRRAEPQVRLSEADAKRREKLIQALRDSLFKKPNLSDYAALRRESKNDPELEKKLDESGVSNLQDDIEQDATKYADLLINNTPWFDGLKEIAETVKIRSGVDEDGVRFNPKNKNIDRGYETSVRMARIKVRGNDGKDESELKGELENYANFAEHFLREAGTLKKIGDRELIKKIKRVRERAAVARRMVEIFDADRSQLKKGTV